MGKPERKVRELEQKSEMEVATAIQQCYRHVFYPSRQRLLGSPVDLAHAAVDLHSASDRPGSGQQQIVQDYARRLSEQETQIGKLRDRQTALDQQKAALQAQLNGIIEKLDF